MPASVSASANRRDSLLSHGVQRHIRVRNRREALNSTGRRGATRNPLPGTTRLTTTPLPSRPPNFAFSFDPFRCGDRDTLDTLVGQFTRHIPDDPGTVAFYFVLTATESADVYQRMMALVSGQPPPIVTPDTGSRSPAKLSLHRALSRRYDRTIDKPPLLTYERSITGSVDAGCRMWAPGPRRANGATGQRLRGVGLCILGGGARCLDWHDSVW